MFLSVAVIKYDQKQLREARVYFDLGSRRRETVCNIWGGKEGTRNRLIKSLLINRKQRRNRGKWSYTPSKPTLNDIFPLAWHHLLKDP